MLPSAKTSFNGSGKLNPTDYFASMALKSVNLVAGAMDADKEFDCEGQTVGEHDSLGGFFHPVHWLSDEALDVGEGKKIPENGVYSLAGGYYGVAIALSPALFGAGKKSATGFSEILRHANDPDALIQVMSYTSPDVSRIISGMTKRIVKKTKLAWAIAGFLGDYYQSAALRSNKGNETQFPYHDRVVVLTIKTKPRPELDELSSQNEALKCFFERLVKYRELVQNLLQGAGFGNTVMHPRHLRRVFNTILNQGPNSRWLHETPELYNPNKKLHEQFADPFTEIYTAPLKGNRGKKYIHKIEPGKQTAIGVIRVKLFDQEVDHRFANLLAGDVWTPPNDDTRAFYNRNIVTTTYSFASWTEAALKLTLSEWGNKINNRIGALRPVAEKSLAEIRQTKTKIKHGEKYVFASTSIVIFSDRENIAGDTRKALTLFRQSSEDRTQINVEMEQTDNDISHFLHCLPFGACDDYRKRSDNRHAFQICTSEVAGYYAPICGDYTGHDNENAGMVCAGRSGQLGRTDYHLGDDNPNGLILGSTGAGKSFGLTHNIVASAWAGRIVRLIEEGGSSKRAMEVLEGEYIDIVDQKNGKKFSFNPFLCLRGVPVPESYQAENAESGDAKEDSDFANLIESLISQITIMATPSPEHKLSAREISKLREIVPQVAIQAARNNEIANMPAVKQALIEDKTEEASALIVALSAFFPGGHYYPFVAGENGIQWSNDLVGIDMKSLNGTKQLKSVICMNICLAIMAEVNNENLRHHEKLIIVDEAWSLLEDEEMASFVERLYRQIRKAGGSVLMATQSVADFLKSPIHGPVLTNAYKIFCLYHNDSNMGSVREAKLFGDEKTSQLSKQLNDYLAGCVTKKKGDRRYSEILCYLSSKNGGGASGGVIRFALPKLFAFLYTTKAEEVAAMNEHARAIRSRPGCENLSEAEVFVETLSLLGESELSHDMRSLRRWIHRANVEFDAEKLAA